MYISAIVPLYKGKKYLSAMIQQFEACQECLQDDIKLELILSNDYPQEEIAENVASTNLNVIVLNTNKNRGIHGARVRGLKAAKGDYILFLDQDDKISANYFKSQLSAIKGADAVVCGCIHENRKFYDERKPMSDVLTKERMIGEYNYIVSPGQVLISRDVIPDVWKENVLKVNGADDWFLWIALFAENKRVVINEDILFEHVVDNCSNASLNSWRMYESEREVLSIVKNNNVLDKYEVELLEGAIANILRQSLNNLDKMKKSFYVYDRWIKHINAGVDIWECLHKEGVHSIAIYGCNNIARNLCDALEKRGFSVSYYIDMNAKHLKESKLIYTLQDDLEMVDLVIIALVEQEKEIRKALNDIGFANVVTVDELI